MCIGDLEKRERLRTEPEWRLDGGNGTEEPADLATGMNQGHDHELEAGLAVVLGMSREEDLPDGGVTHHAAEERCESMPVLQPPEAQEVAAAKLPAEIVANARAGEAEAVGEGPLAF